MIKGQKKIIDNNLNNELCTLTLTLESSTANIIRNNNNDNNSIFNGCLISKRSKGNSSFEKNIYSLVHYQFKKKMDNKTQRLENKQNHNTIRKKKILNSPSTHHPYMGKIFKKNNANMDNKEIFPKNKKIKNSLYTLARKHYKNNCFITNKHGKFFLSPKTTKHTINFNNGIISKLEEFNKNKPINYNNCIHNSAKKNKTYNNTYLNNINNNNNKINKAKLSNAKIVNSINTNTIYKNFSNLSESLNKYKNLCNKKSNITFTNKNNSNISKTKKNNINSTNYLMKSNNNDIKNLKNKTNNNKVTNNKLKQNNLLNTNIHKNSNLNLNININKPQTCHAKNKTFDFNTINQNDPITKYNTNHNFENFKVLLSTKNKNNQKRKKINSKFNLIKKPISEVIKNNPILSPQTKKIYNKIQSNKSISQNKEKKKIIFNGLYNNNNYNIQHNKYELNSPKGKFSNKKKNNMTFSSENNKIENLNIEGNCKNNKKVTSNHKKDIKKKRKKLDLIKGNNNYSNNFKIHTSCISPLSNYSTNLNRLVKNIHYSSFKNSIKMDNSTSQNNSEALKSTKKVKNNNINNINLDNNKYNNNKTNNEFFDMINMNQNDNCTFSRNKKHYSSKISNTQNQNEVNMKDINIKSIQNLKSNCIWNKSNLTNMTCTNDSNIIKSKYNNLNKINSSTEIKNNHIKDVLFNLNKISIKKKAKKNSQRFTKKKKENNFYVKPKKYFKSNRGMMSGDNIFNRKKVIEIKQNSLYMNNRMIQNENNNAKSNNTISHERGNSLQIINVNRNINLFNKNESNKIKNVEI